MKTLPALSFGLLAAVLLGGCGDNSSGGAAGKSESGSSPLTAPADYLGAVGKAQQTAAKTVDTATLNQAIQMFRIDHDRYPNTLQELVDEKVIPRLPDLPRGMSYSYDPKTGTVKVLSQ